MNGLTKHLLKAAYDAEMQKIRVFEAQVDSAQKCLEESQQELYEARERATAIAESLKEEVDA